VKNVPKEQKQSGFTVMNQHIKKGENMNYAFDYINKQLDGNRVDDWHCMIPLSEDGGEMADDMVDCAIPKKEIHNYPDPADYVLIVNEERKGFTEADVIGTAIIQSKDYIYHIFKVGDGHGFMASITRFNKVKHEVTREEWENSYTCG